ncbi:3-deoxy-8-phosphooctulonate synthase [Acetobacteraceae bacterium]|nr:3-deoxy-8-phosphooctulonate synthase [Acetobacteraceae bacterium]
MSISIGQLEIGESLPFSLIAGPCQIESRQHALEVAFALKEITSKLNIGLIYKSSFDKANRTSVFSKRGLGLIKGLDILSEIKEKTNLPVLTDVHLPEQCKEVASVVDVLQIPAFLCRQTDLLLEAGKTNKPVNVKKGQFMAPWQMGSVVEKIKSTGNNQTLLCERGTSFGYGNLVVDMRSLSIMKETGVPIVFDGTHSVQMPGAKGNESGGQREFIAPLSRAAMAVGLSALFLETHPDPDKAPSDGACMLPIKELFPLLKELQAIDCLVKKISL